MSETEVKHQSSSAIDSYCQRARLLQSQGNHAAAVTELKRALVQDEAAVDVYEILAGSLVALGEIEGAIACLQQVIKLDPDTLLAYRAWAQLLVEIEDDQTVAAIYETVHGRFANLAELSQDFACEIAQYFFNRQQNDPHVEPIYNQILENNSDHVPSIAGLAQLYSTQGQWSKSLTYFDRAIELIPGNAMCHFGRGEALFKLGQHESAIESYLTAIDIEPHCSDALNSLGSLYVQLERGPQAVDVLQRAAEIAPQDMSIQNNLGQAWNLQEEFEKATTCFQRVLSQLPNDYFACYSLARIFQKQDRLSLAESFFRRALIQVPNSPFALFHLAGVLKDQQQFDDAITCYKRALENKPGLTPALYELGNVYQRQKDYEMAESFYSQVLERSPNDIPAMISLGNAYKAQDKLDQAAAIYRDILKHQPEKAAWTLWTSTLFPTVMGDCDEIQRYRSHLSDQLTQLTAAKLDLTPQDINGYTCPPPYELQFHGLDNRPLKEAYAQLFLPSFRPRPRKQNTGKPRVGIVVTGGHQGVFMRCMRGILDNLQQSNYQLALLCSRAGAELARRELNTDQVEVMEIPSMFVPALEAVDQAAFDVLYYWEIGSDITNYFLPFFGLAPIQCTGWGVPDTSGIPLVDYYLSSSVIESEADQPLYTEELLFADTLLTWQDRIPATTKDKTRSHWGLNDSDTVYFCVQQVRKLHPDFDHLVAGVLRNDPRGRVALMEDRENYSAKKLVARMAKTIPDVVDRIVTIPYQTIEDYFSLLSLADVMLDTPHFGGGVTTYDSFSLNKPIVTLPGTFRRSRYATACYTMMQIDDCIATSEEDYINKAVKLGTDADYRHYLTQQIGERKQVLFENRQAVSEYDRLFEILAAESRQQ